MGVGIDIGTTSIKVAWTRKSGSQVQLLSAGVARAPVRGMTSEANEDLHGVAEILKKLLSDVGIKSREAVLGLPEADVVTKIIPMPKLSLNELSSAIEWEAEQHVPIPINEANLAFEVVSSTDGPNSQMKVLLVASPKHLVEKYIQVAKAAGIKEISAIETDMIGAARVLARPDMGTVMLVDMGASSMDIGIISKGIVAFTRSVPVAGEALTRAVANALQMDVVQAEEYKKTYGLNASQLEGKVAGALKPVFDVMTTEMAKAAEFYKLQNSGETIKSVMIFGGTAGLPEIVPSMAAALGTEVIIADPFMNLAKDNKQAQTLTGYGPLYPMAVGLAMRE